MKKLVLLFGAFAFIGCGEKKKSGDTAEGGQDAGAIPVAGEEVETHSSGPEPLISDADVERFAKDAFDIEFAAPPAEYTGWIKAYVDGAGTQLAELAQWKNGKADGPAMIWYETGKISDMSIFKVGEMVSRKAYYSTGEKRWTMNPADAGAIDVVCWHKNGRKAATMLCSKEGVPLMEDGAPVFMKIWNEEGKELDLEEGWKMVERLMFD